jgi:hypothetical protein
MIAEVTIEGLVTNKRWTYNEEHLFRLAHFRPIDRNPDFRGKQQVADYFTVRVRGGGIASQLPAPGQHIIVVGYLVDRQENVTLGEFSRRARGDERLPDDVLAVFGSLSEHRSYTEIVATRIQTIDLEARADDNGQRGRSRGGRRTSRRRGRQQDAPAAAPSPDPQEEMTKAA